jgi:hypothetical protein
MNLDWSKLLVIGSTSLLIIAPFVVWGALYVAVRKWSLDLQSLVPWLRGFRWVVWSCGLLLYIGYFVGGHFPWVYPASVATFSVGLVFPEKWLKGQFAAPNSTSE